MARPVTRLMLNVLNSEQFNPIELVEIHPPGASDDGVIRLTNAGEQLDWNGDTWKAIQYSRSKVQEVLSVDSGDQQTVTLTFANIDGQMAGILSHIEMEGARTTVWMHDRKLLLKYPDRSRDAVEVLTGELRNPILSAQTFSFDVTGIIGIMDAINVPRRMYQPTCNYTFGSPSCTVDTTVAPYRIEGTVLSGSTADAIFVGDSVYTDAGSPTNPTDFWKNGMVVMKDGLAACQGRRIIRFSVGGGHRRIHVSQPFLIKPSPGDTIIVLRGCGKTKIDCVDRQGSNKALNFGGFEELPYGDITPALPIKGKV